MTDCVKNEHLIEELNLRQVFKACAGNLKHQNKDIRAAVLELLRQLYVHTQDDEEVFVSHLQNLRPVQEKEVREMLRGSAKEERAEGDRFLLFPGGGAKQSPHPGTSKALSHREHIEKLQKPIGRARREEEREEGH